MKATVQLPSRVRPSHGRAPPTAGRIPTGIFIMPKFPEKEIFYVIPWNGRRYMYRNEVSMIRVFAIRRPEKSTYNYENMELLKQSYDVWRLVNEKECYNLGHST